MRNVVLAALLTLAAGGAAGAQTATPAPKPVPTAAPTVPPPAPPPPTSAPVPPSAPVASPVPPPPPIPLASPSPSASPVAVVAPSCAEPNRTAALTATKPPRAAVGVRESGLVQVDVQLDEFGHVLDASATQGPESLRDIAVQAARAASYRPATSNCVPIPSVYYFMLYVQGTSA